MMELLKLLILLTTISNSIQDDVIVQFTCEYNKRTFRYYKDISCCNIKEDLNIIQENVELQLINDHIPQYTPALSAFRKQINFFPKGIKKNFPNVEYLEIIGSHLLKITSNNLEPLFNLKYLDLSDNSIQTLQENLFQYNPRLVVLILNRNIIKTVHATAFKNLNHLKFLGFEDNRCFSNMSEYSQNVLFMIEDIKYSCSQTYNRLEDNIHNIHMSVEKWNTMQSNLANRVLENANNISHFDLNYSRAFNNYKLEINKRISDIIQNNSRISNNDRIINDLASNLNSFNSTIWNISSYCKEGIHNVNSTLIAEVINISKNFRNLTNIINNKTTIVNDNQKNIQRNNEKISSLNDAIEDIQNNVTKLSNDFEKFSNNSQQQNDSITQNEIPLGFLNLGQIEVIFYLIISNITLIILFFGIVIYLCCTRKSQNKVLTTKQLRIQPPTYRHLLESLLATPSNLYQGSIYGQYEYIDENVQRSSAFEDFYAEATQPVRNERNNDGSEGYAVVYRPERY